MDKDIVILRSNSLFDQFEDGQIQEKIKEYQKAKNLVKSHLTLDLLQPQYRAENAAGNPMFGYCYVASEALYYMFDGEFHAYCGKDERDITHWWLLNPRLNIRLDATCDQYFSQGLVPPYKAGRRLSWMTNEPSKRCRILLERCGYANV